MQSLGYNLDLRLEEEGEQCLWDACSPGTWLLDRRDCEPSVEWLESSRCLNGTTHVGGDGWVETVWTGCGQWIVEMRRRVGVVDIWGKRGERGRTVLVVGLRRRSGKRRSRHA